MDEQQLCRDFLRLNRGRTFDSIEASNLMASTWGIKIDWHEFAIAFEYLSQINQAYRFPNSHSGFSVFFIMDAS